MRMRSYSMGNENLTRKQNDNNENNCTFSGVCSKEINSTSNNVIRRNELIEIIRESMEKNRLCFQSNK
jgi:hypothetical protein